MTDNDTPTITFDSWGERITAHLRLPAPRYANGRICLELWHEVTEDGLTYAEPVGKVTTNLPDQHLNAGEVFVKDWAENEPMVAALVEAGWLEDTGREVLSGFVAPKVYRLAGPLADLS